MAGFGLPVHKNSLRKGRFGMRKMRTRILAMLLAFAMMASMGIWRWWWKLKTQKIQHPLWRIRPLKRRRIQQHLW